MSAVRDGAQWASGSIPPPTSPSPLGWTHHRSRTARSRAGALLVAAVILVATFAVPSSGTAAGGTDILIPRSELLALPTSGTAWSGLKSVADASLGSPNLCDQNSDHGLRTLAAALVFARTGSASYGTKARQGVMAALPTQVVGCGNAVLSLGRQLSAYVIAADLANLSGTDDATFRAWLTTIRTKNIGGHSTWYSLTRTHNVSANNWGAFAGAARIAASLYLGDTTDVANAAKVTQGFLGNRSAYAGFTMTLDSDDLSWSCSGSQSTYTPENPACTKSGINVDGAVVTDISRGGSLRWPPAGSGISYQLETIQGLGLQVEMLYRHGYSGAWGWSSSAMKRMAAVVTRSAAAGGPGWNETSASRQMPWLLNARYGTSIPTQTSGMGRAIGFTDWLYGKGKASAPGPTATPKPGPTATPKPGPTATPKPGPTATPTPGAAPVVTAPKVRVARSSTVPLVGVRSVVTWSLQSSSNGLRRYDLQVKRDGGSFTALTLSSATATSRLMTLATTSDYTFRVRAVDRSGRIGAWRSIGPSRASRISDASTRIAWTGTWRLASSTAYLGRKVHYTRAAGPTATIDFRGTSIAWVGPTGPTRGKAKVYVDGTLVATVNLYTSAYHARRQVFAISVPNGTHRLMIKGLGTAGHPMIAIDAFTVIRPN